jgi:hypothetical protein
MRLVPQPSLSPKRCRLGFRVCPDVPPTIQPVPIPILPPSNLKAFNLFHFNHLPPLCVSLPSFFARRSVFSITSSLFLQNTQGGGTSASPPLRISNIQTLFSRAVCKAVTTPVPRRNPFSVPSVASPAPTGSGWQIQFLFALCFHNLTNPFSRNSRVFTSIQNPGGCTLKQSASAATFGTTHYPLLTSTFGLPTTHYSLSALE